MQKRIARFCIRDEFFAVPPEFRPSLAGRALMDLIPLVFQKGEGPGSANAAAAAGPYGLRAGGAPFRTRRLGDEVSTRAAATGSHRPPVLCARRRRSFSRHCLLIEYELFGFQNLFYLYAQKGILVKRPPSFSLAADVSASASPPNARSAASARDVDREMAAVFGPVFPRRDRLIHLRDHAAHPKPRRDAQGIPAAGAPSASRKTSPAAAHTRLKSP